MTNFIRTKFQRVVEQARFQHVNVVSYLLKKGLEKTGYYVFAILNFLLLLVNLPAYFLILLVMLITRRSTSTNILFIGLEHIIKKTIDRSELFAAKGYIVHYHSLPTRLVAPPLELQDRLYITSRFAFLTIYGFLFSLIRLRPAYVEVYMESSFIELIPEVIICKMLGIPTVVIERGMCLNIEIGNSDVFFRKGLQLLFRIADKVYYREPYLMQHLQKMKIRKDKLVFDYNKIPVSHPEPAEKRNNSTVLFLNSFVPIRRLDLFIESIPIVLKKFPSAKFLAVGSRSKLEDDYAQSLIQKAGVAGKVEVLPYAKDPLEYYRQAAIFVFPADFVFANFSLLEAMEQELVPIVSNVRDADRIVNDGVNGFVVERSATEVADRTIRLLEDEERRIRMGKAAREKIKSEFNHIHRIDSIDEFIRSRRKTAESGLPSTTG